jgi:hypothetical protein
LDLPPCQNQSHAAGLGTARTPIQDAFGRIESRPRDRAKSPGDSFMFTRWRHQHPFIRRSRAPPRQGMGRRAALLCCFRLTLRLASMHREDASHRLLQPTYDTSTRKSFDS